MHKIMSKVILFVAMAVCVLLLMPSAIYAGSVSDEARRYLDRGQMAVEMAKTNGDLSDAIKEFQKAIELAPNWPEPYYSLGMAQNKMEQFDDALKNLKNYLQLAPNASNAKEVKQLINKIEYKKEKADESQAIIKTLTGPGEWRWKSGDQQPNWATKFRLRDGKLEAVVNDPMIGTSWIPIAYDGKQLQYEFTWHHCSFSLDNGCPYKVSVKSEIISTSPLRLKNKAVWARQWGNRSVREDAYVLELVNDR